MSIHPRKAGQLLSLNGPRWYFEVESVAGAGAHLDHALWRFPGVRFLVHMTAATPTEIVPPTEYATGLIGNIQTFKSNFLAAQPPGTPFPGYGVRFPGIGGWYAWIDFDGYIPSASNHLSDSLPQFINAFTYTPINDEHPQTGFVSDVGQVPSADKFEIGSGTVHGRPFGGLEMNRVRFTDGPLSGAGERTVLTWASNVVELASAFLGAPAVGNRCIFETFPPPACYRFSAGRSALLTWSVAFFDELDVAWPVGVERPELVAATTENFAEPENAWHPTLGSMQDYVAAEDDSPLTDSLSLTEWMSAYGRNLAGSTITLPGTTDLNQRSPEAQDFRSLASGAFFIGLAWTWQLSFVNRMKQSWPRTKFTQYQLHAGNRRSPMINQPGEEFYHGDPWPPDVGHSHDEYNAILPYLFDAAERFPGVVDASVDPSFFSVESGEFLTITDWGADDRYLLRFDPNTATEALQGHLATIADWSDPIVSVETALPELPTNEDTFAGYIEVPGYDEWASEDVGWAIWKAWEAHYGHTTGTLDERYRATCVSFVADAAARMCNAWPDRDVVPFVSRWAEDHPEGAYILTDTQMYPDPRFVAQPGIQTREDWITMLTGMMDCGIPSMVVFEPQEQLEAVLDSWVEIFTGVRAFYERNIWRYQMIAPHLRNRHWRNRRLWRH